MEGHRLCGRSPGSDSGNLEGWLEMTNKCSGELKEVRRHCYQLVGGRAGGKSPPAHHVKFPNLSGLPAVLIFIPIKEF